MLKVKLVSGIIAILVLLTGSSAPFLVSITPVTAQAENPYLIRTFADEDGNQIDEVIVPGRPPEIKVAIAEVPEPHIAMGTNTLTEVPAFDWSYGSSATSAAMLFGYYDRTGYSDMYTGPTNGGLCPLDNSIWGETEYTGVTCHECPLSATHNGVDGRTSRGHVGDYWIDLDDPGPDPWEIEGWPQHTPGDCTGDFMGTNQSAFGNIDGATYFYYYTEGDPLYDYTGCEPDNRDGCHGLRLFAESRGYSVQANFTQYIKGQGSYPDKGFTFSDYMAEIDAGRPVLIQLVGHTMLGYGYNTEGNIVYIYDTSDHNNHQMTWGGTYNSLQHKGVTVIQLGAPVPLLVTTNNASSISDSSATLNGNLDDLGTASTVYVSFEHGLTTDYGYRTPPQEMTTTGTFSFYLTGLCPNNTYHFRAKAVGDETSYGGDKTFTASGGIEAVTVSIDAPAEVAPNSDFTAEVDISQVDNFDAASYNVSFNDAILRLDDVTAGEIDGTTIPVDIWNEISPGEYTITQNVPGLSGATGSGTLAALHFHVVGTSCQTSGINLSDGTLGNNQSEEIPATWIGDSVHVFNSAVIPGDANEDGIVNALDITKVERIIAGLDTATPGADANQDGVVNALDITETERIIAGLD